MNSESRIFASASGTRFSARRSAGGPSLKFGHRGGNQPVSDLGDRPRGNHLPEPPGFAVDAASLPRGLGEPDPISTTGPPKDSATETGWFLRPVPSGEASPGPHDSNGLFAEVSRTGPATRVDGGFSQFPCCLPRPCVTQLRSNGPPQPKTGSAGGTPPRGNRLTPHSTSSKHSRKLAHMPETGLSHRRLHGSRLRGALEKASIGRLDDNRFPIAEPSVSSHHCEVGPRGRHRGEGSQLHQRHLHQRSPDRAGEAPPPGPDAAAGTGRIPLVRPASGRPSSPRPTVRLATPSESDHRHRQKNSAFTKRQTTPTRSSSRWVWCWASSSSPFW